MVIELVEIIKLIQSDQINEAKNRVSIFLEKNINNLDALNIYSVILLKKKEYEKAIKILKKIIEADENNFSIINNIGIAYLSLNQHKKALFYFKKAIEIKPDYELAHINLGATYSKLDNYELALKEYKKAIKIKPINHEVYFNISIIYKKLENYKLAIEALNKSIEIKNDYSEAYNEKGKILIQLEDFNEAFLCFNKVLSINDRHIESLMNVAGLFSKAGKIEESINCLEKILKIEPNTEEVLGNLLSNQMRICDWSNYENITNLIKQKIYKNKIPCNPFINLLISNSPEESLIISKNFNKNKEIKLEKNKILLKKNKKIKIAYFSSDFNDHPVGWSLINYFKNHNKDKFEVLGFYLGNNFDNEVLKKIKEAFDQFFIINKKSTLEIVELCKKLELDIAIDLNGYTDGNRINLFSKRIAPVQINAIGYPGTLGVKFYDYILADRNVIPEKNQKYFAEKIIYMPNFYLPYTSNDILNKKKSRKDFNLPENQFIFFCIANIYKINPRIFLSWLKILKSTNKTCLLLSTENKKIIQNLIEIAKENNIDEKRLIFVERLNNRSDYFTRLSLMDIFLDTFPYGAHMTAMESIKCGVPIITIKGNSFHSRVCYGLLKELKLDELIADSYEEYEKIAIQLCNLKDELKKLKNKLIGVDINSNVFNYKKYILNFEKGIETAYNNYQKKLINQNIYIN